MSDATSVPTRVGVDASVSLKRHLRRLFMSAK